MLEGLFVIYLVTLFAFPAPVSGLTVIAGGGIFVRRQTLLWRAQPSAGKKLLLISGLSSLLNFVISLALSFALTRLVAALIFDYLYLSLFNFAFCFLVSLRWFDFTHALHRAWALRLNPHPPPPAAADSIFAVYVGLRKGAPVFHDAGYLTWRAGAMSFAGAFLAHTFTGIDGAQARKLSAEKIKITPAAGHPLAPDEVIIILKGQFYPFKNRERRDAALRALSAPAA